MVDDEKLCSKAFTTSRTHQAHIGSTSRNTASRTKPCADVVVDVFPMCSPMSSRCEPLVNPPPQKTKARQNENMGTPCNLAWMMDEKTYSNVFAAARAHRQRIRNESRDTTLLVQTMCSPCSCRCKRWTHRDSVSCKKSNVV